MCGGGGGGGSGTQKYEWNDDMRNVWIGSINRAVAESEKQYQPYAGGDPNARIAPINNYQSQAAQNMWNYADALQSPHQAQNAAIGQLESTLSGDYLNADPYATQRNQYSGMNNPFFADVMQQGMDSIVSNYQNSTSPELTRLMNMNGAFGGSAHLKAQADNQAALGKTLQNYAAQMGNDQYNRSGQMEEGYLNRGSGAFQNERQRQMGAIGGAQAEQNNVMQRLQGLMSMGDMYRSYDQDVKNYAYENWLGDQNENRTGLDFLTGILSRAQGGMSNLTTTAPSYQVSPYSALMGSLMAYGAMR